jgi:hypothetical protein
MSPCLFSPHTTALQKYYISLIIYFENQYCYENIAFFLGNIALWEIFFTIIGVRILIFKSNLLLESLSWKSHFQEELNHINCLRLFD